jgi:hypothetical protein
MSRHDLKIRRLPEELFASLVLESPRNPVCTDERHELSGRIRSGASHQRHQRSVHDHRIRVEQLLGNGFRPRKGDVRPTSRCPPAHFLIAVEQAARIGNRPPTFK